MPIHQRMKALTLAELLVVLAILSILTFLLLPKLIGYSGIARDVAVEQNARTVKEAAMLYVVDCDKNGTQPADKLTENSTVFVNDYLDQVPEGESFVVNIGDKGQLDGYYEDKKGNRAYFP